jgi:hypothetical protein
VGFISSNTISHRNGKRPASSASAFQQPEQGITLESAGEEFLGHPSEPVASPLARDAHRPTSLRETKDERVEDHEEE